MTKPRKDAVEALQIALDNEKKGYRFYKRAALNSRDPKGREVFDRLAKDETEHMGAIATVYEALTKNRPWMTYDQAVALYGTTPSVDLVFPRAPRKAQAGFDDLLALEEALGIEKKAVAFYREKAADNEDPTARSFYLSLVQIEESHQTIIQAEIDSLTGTGIWLGYQEISLEH